MQFDPGKRYGLTGANGAGQVDPPQDAGRPGGLGHRGHRDPRALRLGVLKQNHFAYDQQRILDTVIMGNAALWAAMAEKEKLLAGEVTDEVGVRLGRARGDHRRGERLHGRERGRRAAGRPGHPRRASTREPMSTLPAGYKLRVLIAQVLFGRPDVLLLDEPTNHLDLESIRWLERFLIDEFKGTLVVVSPRPPLPERGRDAHRRRRLPDHHRLHGQLRRLRRRQVREQAARRGADGVGARRRSASCRSSCSASGRTPRRSSRRSRA